MLPGSVFNSRLPFFLCWNMLEELEGKRKSCVDSLYIYMYRIHIQISYTTPTFTKNNDTSSSMSRYVKMVGVDEHFRVFTMNFP